MLIELKKFGTTLISRQLGKEAFTAFQPSLAKLTKTEKINLDFSGVITLSPSWANEFLSPLLAKYGDGLILHESDNPSVVATLSMLEKINNRKFNIYTSNLKG